MLSVSRFLPLALLASFLAAPALASVIDPLARRTKSAHDKYTTAHSLGEDYNFHSRDGWMTLNFTDPHPSSRRADPVLPAGATHTSPQSFEEHWLAERASGKKHGSSKKKGGSIDVDGNIAHPKILAAEPVDGILGEVSQALHPVGEAEDVIITWYTGHDLLNPSCWPTSDWSPTDASFVAALTLEGWTTKPQCFKFLEICNGPQKCVYVRVVDTCAGCAAASKHVDLTRAAFGALADFDEGVLNVQMRPASDPADAWFEDLWGPKSN